VDLVSAKGALPYYFWGTALGIQSFTLTKG
jgi:hypothetical protein